MASSTYKKVAVFREIGSLFLRNTPNTKLSFAVKKLISKTDNIQEEYVDKQNELRIDHASVDKDKNLIQDKDTKEYTFTADNLKKLSKELRDLSNKEVEIEQHIVTKDVPPDLSFQYNGADGKYHDLSDYDVRSAFENLVLPEAIEPE